MSSQIINYCPCPFIKDKKTSPKKGISAGKIRPSFMDQTKRSGMAVISFYYSLDPSFLLSLPFSSVSVTPEYGSNL